jgi:hypothetical protein
MRGCMLADDYQALYNYCADNNLPYVRYIPDDLVQFKFSHHYSRNTFYQKCLKIRKQILNAPLNTQDFIRENSCKHGYHSISKEFCANVRFYLVNDQGLGVEQNTSLQLIKIINHDLYEFLMYMGFGRPVRADFFVRIAGELSDLFKTYNEVINFPFPARMVYNVDHLMGHFSRDIVDFDPDISALDHLKPKGRVLSRSFRYYLETETKRMLNFLELRDVKHDNFDDFLKDHFLWRRPSATTYSKEYKSKMMLGEHDFNEYKKIIEEAPTIVKPVIKKERGKVRLAFSVDTTLNLQMQYLMQSINGVKLPFSAMNYGPHEERGLRERISRNLASGWVSVPLDFKSYDKYVSKREVMIVVRIILRYLVNHSHLSDGQVILNKTMNRLSSLYYINKNKTIEWANGMLSGLQITALFNTFMSYLWTTYSAKSQGIEILDILSQGDDALFFTSSFTDAYKIVEGIGYLGLKYNPKKFYISLKRAEFLRTEYTQYDYNMYMCRIIIPLIQSKPWKMDSHDLQQEISATIANVVQLCDRAGYEDKIKLINKVLTRRKLYYPVTKTSVNQTGYSFTNVPISIKLRAERDQINKVMEEIVDEQFGPVHGTRRRIDMFKAKYKTNAQFCKLIEYNFEHFRKKNILDIAGALRDQASRDLIYKFNDLCSVVEVKTRAMDGGYHNRKGNVVKTGHKTSGNYFGLLAKAEFSNELELLMSRSKVREWIYFPIEHMQTATMLAMRLGKGVAMDVLFDRLACCIPIRCSGFDTDVLAEAKLRAKTLVRLEGDKANIEYSLSRICFRLLCM